MENSSPDDAGEIVRDAFELRLGLAQPRLLLFAQGGEARLKLLYLVMGELELGRFLPGEISSRR
jgi:hypothetical protein